jgi:hypothetical protein
MLYKKIQDGQITKSHEEYDKLIEQLSKSSEVSMTIEELKYCIEYLKNQKLREKFHNPYLKRSSSSHDSIEENI